MVWQRYVHEIGMKIGLVSNAVKEIDAIDMLLYVKFKFISLILWNILF